MRSLADIGGLPGGRDLDADDAVGLSCSFDAVHAPAGLSVRVNVQDLQVLQGRLIDLVVVLGRDAVDVGLAVLAEQD